MLEFQPSGKIKLYDGSSDWSTQPVYTVDTWRRISIKIDNSGTKCQNAIDGVLINKSFAFREIKSCATSFDFHSIRFSMDAGTANAAIDNLYIGSTPISDITFQATSTDKSISVTQPAYGTISLSPLKSVYQLNDHVTASISVPEHYSYETNTSSTSSVLTKRQIQISPNPFKGTTHFVFPPTMSSDKITVTVYNSTGKKYQQFLYQIQHSTSPPMKKVYCFALYNIKMQYTI